MRLGLKRLLVTGFIAAIVASLANTIVFVVDTSLLNISLLIPAKPGSTELLPLSLWSVVGASAAGAFLGAIAFAFLLIFTENSVKVFLAAGLIFLLLSLIAPIALDADLQTKIALVVMHIVAGGAAIGVIIKSSREIAA